MAFLQPAPPRQPIFNIPGAVLWLIVGLVLAHVARTQLITPEQSEIWIEHYAFIPAHYSPAYLAASGIDPGAWWQRALPFVSYMALHNDFGHLAINSLALLAFGPVVARRFGGLLFLAFFILCGVAGAGACLMADWGSPAAVIGASGAISGLMAAAFRLLPNYAPEPVEPALMPILSRQFLLFSLVWIGINVIAGVTGLGVGGQTILIAWQAHLGGFLAGVLFTGPFDRLRPERVGVSVE